MKTTEIINKYTAGEKTLEETNKALAKAKAGFHLDPNKNAFTVAELHSGWGLLSTGTGTFDKVKVVNGELERPVNEVLPNGETNMYAMCFTGGKAYEVKGKKLVLIEK